MGYEAKLVKECNLTIQEVKAINKENKKLEQLLQKITGFKVLYNHRSKIKKDVTFRGCEILIIEEPAFSSETTLNVNFRHFQMESELTQLSVFIFLERLNEHVANFGGNDFTGNIVLSIDKYLLSNKLKAELPVSLMKSKATKI